MDGIIGSAWAAAAAERTPFSFDLLTYAWVLVLAAAGGFVSFIRKVRQGQTRAFNLVEFIGEIATSAFVGLITFWLCEWAQFDKILAAVLIAITGHMGSRAMFFFESVLEKWVSEKTGVIVNEQGDKVKKDAP